MSLERNKTIHHNEDGSRLREYAEKLGDKDRIIKGMNMEVMILVGAIAFLGLVLLAIIFCLFVFFYKERKEAN